MHIAYRKNIVTIFNRVYYLNLTAKKKSTCIDVICMEYIHTVKQSNEQMN